MVKMVREKKAIQSYTEDLHLFPTKDAFEDL